MTDWLARTFCAAALILGNQAAAGQDLLLQARPGELLVGPIQFSQPVLGIDLALRASAFLVATPADEQLAIDARVVADLFQLQDNIGKIVDTIPLPANNCDHQGGDNLFARIWGKRLTIDSHTATVTLNGDVEKWFCTPFRWRIKQPFDATLPFTLERDGSYRVVIKLGRPDVKLGGSLGDVTSTFVQLVTGDINSRIKEGLDRTIDPKLLRVAIPEYLLWLHPAITQAEFLSNNGALAASVQMNTSLDSKAIVELVNALINRPHGETGGTANGSN